MILQQSQNRSKKLPRSMLKQNMFDLCGIDQVISRLANNHPYLLESLFHLRHMRARTFFTKSEIANRSPSVLIQPIAYQPNDPHNIPPQRYAVLHYLPLPLPAHGQFHRPCQFCPNSERSTQHLILECQDQQIVDARNLALLRLRNTLISPAHLALMIYHN